MALDLIGDPWSLLVIRDLMFKGRSRFKDFLEAGEGISTNVLADRLQRLEDGGIIAGRPDPDDRRRVLYALTRKGVELAPVLVELVLWSARHHDTGAPAAVLKLMERQREAFIRDIHDDWSRGQHADPRAGRGARRVRRTR